MLPRKYPELFDDINGYLEIYRNDRSRQSVILPRLGVRIVPLPEPDSESLKVRRRKKYGVYRI